MISNLVICNVYFQMKRERERLREKEREVMKYLEVEVKEAPERGGLRLRGSSKRIEAKPSDGASDVTNRRSPIRSNERSSMLESRCDVPWTRTQVILADQSPMQRCPIRLLAYVAALDALLY